MQEGLLTLLQGSEYGVNEQGVDAGGLLTLLQGYEYGVNDQGVDAVGVTYIVTRV